MEEWRERKKRERREYERRSLEQTGVILAYPPPKGIIYLGGSLLCERCMGAFFRIPGEEPAFFCNCRTGKVWEGQDEHHQN